MQEIFDVLDKNDVNIIDDTNPYKGEEEKANTDKKEKSTSMNFFTALSLSFKNLLTKKGRTILTSFAGSIGIIGIATILALANGVQNYIDMVEEDTLSSYPITIEKSTVDMTSMMEAMMGENEDDIDNNFVDDFLEIYWNSDYGNSYYDIKKVLDELIREYKVRGE